MRTNHLAGKRAFVTGAASGIGRALALELARHGTHVWLLDVRRDALEETVDEVRRQGVDAEGIRCDLACSEQISRAVRDYREHWGELDLLVNNAGVAYYGPMERMTDEQWQWLFAVNVWAPVQLTRELLPLLLRQRRSHVLNMASIAGLVGGRRLAAYHTTKFAMVGFSESMRVEYATRGLGVTTVCPGLVQTKMIDNIATAPDGRGPKRPPNWLCSSPELVAKKAIRGVVKNRGLVVVSPMARVLWYTKRFSPTLLDRISCFHRRRKERAAPKLAVFDPPPASNKREDHDAGVPALSVLHPDSRRSTNDYRRAA